jgi:hypothetical protein
VKFAVPDPVILTTPVKEPPVNVAVPSVIVLDVILVKPVIVELSVNVTVSVAVTVAEMFESPANVMTSPPCIASVVEEPLSTIENQNK